MRPHGDLNGSLFRFTFPCVNFFHIDAGLVAAEDYKLRDESHMIAVSEVELLPILEGC